MPVPFIVPFFRKNDIIALMRLSKRAISILAAISIALSVPRLYAADETGRNLAKFVKDQSPWLHIQANSEQRQPFYIGATPREIALGLEPADGGRVLLYESLRTIGESQAAEVRDGLVSSDSIAKGDGVEFEMWPVRDERGRLTWAFARWRPGRGKPWQRLNASILPEAGKADNIKARPVLPITLDPAKKSDFSRIFDDDLSFKGLNEKPLFGDCLWMTSEGIALDAWMLPEQREAFGREVSDDIKKMGASLMCRVLPQPARLNGRPITFIVKIEGDKVVWQDGMQWKKEDTSLPQGTAPGPVIKEWPKDLADGYKEDVLLLSGEKPAGKDKIFFKKKNNAEKDNQLQAVVDYLDGRYKGLGIKTRRQEFSWRGTRHANLVAVIRGTDPMLAPLVVADHIDTGFCEDIFDKTGNRVSSAGADDDASATAAMLRGAKILIDAKLPRDIWLVHFTGSEYPADSLGARRFVSAMLSEKGDLAGVVLLESLGTHDKAAGTIRIDAGDAPGSLGLAKISADAAKDEGLEPSIKTRFGAKNALSDTDGAVFSEAGYPVICIRGDSEVMTGPSGVPRQYSTDTAKNIDWGYAVSAAKAAIETAARLASESNIGSPAPRIPAKGAQSAQLPSAKRSVIAPRAAPAWSVAAYMGFDESDRAKAYNPRLKEMLEAPVPEGVEVLIERDVDWPDGSARIARTSVSHEEKTLQEQDSASAATLQNFLRWAGDRAKGRNRLLVIQGSSSGWSGAIKDNTVPERRGTSSLMPLGEMARAIRDSGFKPDLVIFDISGTGGAEAIEALKDAAPYIVVSQLDVPYNGFPAGKLFKMAVDLGPGGVKPGLSARELAANIPEEYVKEYARDGSMAEAENKYFIVTVSAVDTAKWSALTAGFRNLVEALARAGFREKLAARPEWAAAFVDRNNNADIVEFLNRLPLLVEDQAVIAAAGRILDIIGYPGDAAAENASSITIDPAETRSFELRIETCPYLQKDKALEEIRSAWRSLNQDLKLPQGLTYDVHDFWDDKRPKREFIVRCPDGVLKEAVSLRPWLAGAKYCLLKTVDRGGRAADKRYIKGTDYISVKEFPETSFMVSEAHNQGAPFIHGTGVSLNGSGAYNDTAWSKSTGWGSLIGQGTKK